MKAAKIESSRLVLQATLDYAGKARTKIVELEAAQEPEFPHLSRRDKPVGIRSGQTHPPSRGCQDLHNSQTATTRATFPRSTSRPIVKAP
jgi:hypothetical protein